MFLFWLLRFAVKQVLSQKKFYRSMFSNHLIVCEITRAVLLIRLAGKSLKPRNLAAYRKVRIDPKNGVAQKKRRAAFVIRRPPASLKPSDVGVIYLKATAVIYTLSALVADNRRVQLPAIEGREFMEQTW